MNKSNFELSEEPLELSPETTAESLRLLIENTIDYAGLFPPSELSMQEAVLNFATYRNSNYSWMLGRFVVHVNRLQEFLSTARDFLPNKRGSAWHLSVIASENMHETLRAVEELNLEYGPGVICDSLEIKVTSQEEITTITNETPKNYLNYFEVPLDERLPELISSISINEQRAKIRMGGVTPDLFPSSADAIRFIRTCLAGNVAFKATAGLHHPIRSFKPLTYKENAPCGTMHGFLNLFVATVFAKQGAKSDVLEEIFEDEFFEAFDFGNSGLTWHKEFSLSNAQIIDARKNSIISFGSCSFDEPIADLREMNLL